MNRIYSPDELRNFLADKSNGIGFVPTMGALHKGHISLINKSLEENEITVVSIFVNPTQFNDPRDLENYPSTIEKDLIVLDSLDVDCVFMPSKSTLYADDYAFRIIENKFSRQLCGENREGHFEGVLTIVMKLLNIVKPTTAYFGEKDYQQYLLIRGMIDAFHMNVKVVSLPTIRQEDGLALSSRNQLLSAEERKRAPRLSSLLKSEKSDDEVKNFLIEEGFKVDYIETLNNRRFGAVFLGNVRLIDNVKK